jgi:Transposase.
MGAAKYSDEFKEQVALEVIRKERTISSVAQSYGLVAQTVGLWVKKYREKHPEVAGGVGPVESEELKRIRRENRELRMENEFLKKPPPSSRRTISESSLRAHSQRRRKLHDQVDVQMCGGVEVWLPGLAGSTSFCHSRAAT